jgi:bifunctional DNase/RNase
VVVDNYLAAQRIYEAKLHLQQTSGMKVVDVRISDAVILAVVCNVPIRVSEDVLAAVAQTQP